jgi:hypothetical protein
MVAVARPSSGTASSEKGTVLCLAITNTRIPGTTKKMIILFWGLAVGEATQASANIRKRHMGEDGL